MFDSFALKPTHNCIDYQNSWRFIFFSLINQLIVGALLGFASEYGDTTSGNLYCSVVAQDVFGKFIHDERGACKIILLGRGCEFANPTNVTGVLNDMEVSM